MLVGLVSDGALVDFTLSEERPQRTLHAAIERMMRTADDAVSEFAVVAGPGNWTSINVGVVAAKTLASLLDVDLLSLSFLDALAGSVDPINPSSMLPVVRATSKSHYCGLWDDHPGSFVAARKSGHELGDFVRAEDRTIVTPAAEAGELAALLPRARVLGANRDGITSAYVRAISTGRAVRMSGFDVNRAVPEYGGDDPMVSVTEGSFR